MFEESTVISERQHRKKVGAMKNLLVEPIGIVYRVSDANGGVLTSEEEGQVRSWFERVGMRIEEHQPQRIDGTHIVMVEHD